MALVRQLTTEEKRTIGHWAMELVVVVAGVLIALWLQEWAQRRQALQNMYAAEEAIHDEVTEALLSLIWRQAISQCHRERAELLESRLLSGGSRWPGLDDNAIIEAMGKLPGSAGHSVYQRPVDTFTSSAWNSALATGALLPMDRKRFGQLIALYDQIEFLRKTRDIEDEAAARLSPLGYPVVLTPELKAEMLRGLYDINRTRFVFGFQGNPVEFGSLMRPLGWNDAAEIDRRIAQSQRDIAERQIKFKPCVAKEKNPFRAS
jgi:hypothetical protein